MKPIFWFVCTLPQRDNKWIINTKTCLLLICLFVIYLMGTTMAEEGDYWREFHARYDLRRRNAHTITPPPVPDRTIRYASYRSNLRNVPNPPPTTTIGHRNEGNLTIQTHRTGLGMGTLAHPIPSEEVLADDITAIEEYDDEGNVIYTHPSREERSVMPMGLVVTYEVVGHGGGHIHTPQPIHHQPYHTPPTHTPRVHISTSTRHGNRIVNRSAGGITYITDNSPGSIAARAGRR